MIVTINSTSMTTGTHPNENHIIIIGMAESNIHNTGIIQKMKVIIARVNIYGKVVAQCTKAMKYNQTMVSMVFTQEIRLCALNISQNQFEILPKIMAYSLYRNAKFPFFTSFR